MATLEYTSELVVVECWCGMPHAVPSSLRDFQLRQHRNGVNNVTSIYCPLGHAHQPAGEGRAARLARELDEERARASAIQDQLNAEKRSHRATKGKLTKANTRSKNGVCPHPDCKRSFVDVARHVRTKHPELVT